MGVDSPHVKDPAPVKCLGTGAQWVVAGAVGGSSGIAGNVTSMDRPPPVLAPAVIAAQWTVALASIMDSPRAAGGCANAAHAPWASR